MIFNLKLKYTSSQINNDLCRKSAIAIADSEMQNGAIINILGNIIKIIFL